MNYFSIKIYKNLIKLRKSAEKNEIILALNSSISSRHCTSHVAGAKPETFSSLRLAECCYRRFYRTDFR